MLKDKDAGTSIAVKDLNAAGKFYGDTLGLQRVDQKGDGVIAFQTGNSKFFVYQSQFAGTNKATTMTWLAGNELEDLVKSLKSKGVSFEHYDMPGMKREGDIHINGATKAVWFKDPDGNILSLVSG